MHLSVLVLHVAISWPRHLQLAFSDVVEQRWQPPVNRTVLRASVQSISINRTELCLARCPSPQAYTSNAKGDANLTEITPKRG